MTDPGPELVEIALVPVDLTDARGNTLREGLFVDL